MGENKFNIIIIIITRRCVEASNIKLRSLKPIKPIYAKTMPAHFALLHAFHILPLNVVQSQIGIQTAPQLNTNERTNKQTNVITKFRSVPPSMLNEQPIAYMKAVRYEKG